MNVCRVLLVWIVVILSLFFETPLLAQRLNFITATPNIDSFPVVRIKFTASYNGFAPVPTVTGSQFVVKEDNVVVPAEVVSCDGIPQSAVVFCTDASTSMISSAGNTSEVYDVFYRCFGSCLELLPMGSRYSLITFYDHNIEPHPGPGHVNGFYDAGNKADSMDFVDALKHLPYFGGTYVDEALDKAIELLRYQPLASKAIVLVTDDAAYDIWHFDSLMKALNITLYVMEVGSDTSPHNIDLSHKTGGAYFQATDSTNYEPVMAQIGELIGSEHCFLRYVSPNACPWYASHSISMSLTHKTLTRLATGNYTLFRNFLDKTGPLITESSPFYISRLVTASEYFPCERGLYFATDSIRDNFSLRTRKRSFNHFFPKINGSYVDSDYFSMQDSIVVIDTMQNARAVYTAMDSAGNTSKYEVVYQPKADILVPVLNQAFSSGGKYTVAATEARAWDRGLTDIRLASGAINIVLDSIRIFNRRTGNGYVRILDLTQPAHGCIEAVDSVGNVGSFCIDKTIGPGPSDLLSPVIKQDPIVFPKPIIIGRVTENQLKDKGIKIVTIEPAVNIFTPILSYNSKSLASFSVSIVDTLQPVRAWISATDSAGNTALDTLRYDPLPDNTSPVCMIDAPNATTRTMRASELAPWDRGIKSVTIVGTPINLTASPVTNTRWNAEQTFTVVDPTLQANVVVSVLDSADHECLSTITIDVEAIKPIGPLQAQLMIDFLTHQAPFDSTATITITNPNEQPVIATKIIQSGDAEFTSTLSNPLVFQPFEKRSVSIRFTTGLLGIWNGSFELANDTMTLARVTATAKTTGVTSIFLDRVTAPFSQTSETFTIKIAAQPAPINLDSIRFDLVFDGDLVWPNLINLNSSLVNYQCIPTVVAEGRIQFLLSRNNRLQLATIDTNAATITLPFTTFVSRNSSTPVFVENTYAGVYSTVIFDTGSISIGNQCGDQTLRASLNNNLEAFLKSAAPNPASSQVSISIISTVDEQESVLSLTDHLGRTLLRNRALLHKGENTIVLPLNGIAAGNYILGLRTSSSTTLPLKVIR